MRTRMDFVSKETATGCHLAVFESGFSARLRLNVRVCT